MELIAAIEIAIGVLDDKMEQTGDAKYAHASNALVDEMERLKNT